MFFLVIIFSKLYFANVYNIKFFFEIHASKTKINLQSSHLEDENTSKTQHSDHHIFRSRHSNPKTTISHDLSPRYYTHNCQIFLVYHAHLQKTPILIKNLLNTDIQPIKILRSKLKIMLYSEDGIYSMLILMISQEIDLFYIIMKMQEVIREDYIDIGARLPFIRYLVQWTNSDVLIVGYRGYSDSEGKPSEAGIKKDGVAILNKAI